MFFNDFEKCLKHSQSLNFADDTVVYVHGKTKDIVESQLNEDLKNMSTYFKTNQLIINLNWGKTETMIFGTSYRLSKCGKKLNLYYDDRVIHVTETYKYLGTILDSTLSFSINFDRMNKKTTSKFCRLYSLRMHFDSFTKAKIFKAMILPSITYNCTVNLNLTQTQRQKLQTIDRLAEKIIGKKQTSIKNEIKKHSLMLVRKYVQKETCENSKDYFKIQSHDRVTRNENYLVQIPKTKLKYAKNGFFSMRVTLYNKLPTKTRKIENFNAFRKGVFNLYG